MTEQTHSGATGAKYEVHLSKRDVSTAAWRWAFFCLASQNYERMMGCPARCSAT